MHIILGASGQVGSAVVANLLEKEEQVKAIVRDNEKEEKLKETGAETAIADAKNIEELINAFRDGETLFALTPETGKEKDVLGETKLILDNYRKAVEKSSIKKIVALSSIGAQHDKGTGNLLMSNMLENTFNDLGIEVIFVRPAYYFSNWLPYLPNVKESGILPTFFPIDLSIPMVSPMDVALLISNLLVHHKKGEKIYELSGPASYTSSDIAAAFSKALNRPVKAQPIDRNEWEETLAKTGFSEDGIKNFIEMTEAVIEGKVTAQRKGTFNIKGLTTLQQYIDQSLAK